MHCKQGARIGYRVLIIKEICIGIYGHLVVILMEYCIKEYIEDLIEVRSGFLWISYPKR